jgi:hypothetical protein
MAKIVKMEFECSDMDVNDMSEAELVVRGLSLGKYIMGKRNAWEIDYFEKNGEPIADMSCYIAGLLHRKFNMEVKNADDVKAAQNILEEKYGMSIIECFYRMLDGNSFFPDEI